MGNGFELKEGRSGLNIWKKFFTFTGTSCPEKFWMLRLWKCSKPGWTGLGANWSIGRCPHPWQRCHTE